MKRPFVQGLLFALLLATPALARVLSYAAYTDKSARVAFSERTARHFAIVETEPGGGDAQVVLYDSQGLEEPRVIYPRSAESPPYVEFAAVYEKDSSLILLVHTHDTNWTSETLISTDGGATWTRVPDLYNEYIEPWPYDTDIGGPFTRGISTSVRLGSGDWPFVVMAANDVRAINRNGTTRVLATDSILAGTNRAGDRFLVRAGTTLAVVDLNGNETVLGTSFDAYSLYSGWVTANGNAYVVRGRAEGRFLYRVTPGAEPQFIAGPYGVAAPNNSAPYTYRDAMSFFAVPTYDFEGAWTIQRDNGKPTTLSRYLPATGLQKMWEDVTGPQVEALHAGSSGERLLVQVHRPRVAPDALFVDPALAVWKIGEPAPNEYDELFLNEGLYKGFVHVDPETIASGEGFVFDSATQAVPPPDVIISPAPGGGGDVVQEWGVVRSSLKQRLVLPGVARLDGAFGSFWLTDVAIYNPFDERQQVQVKYVPLGEVQAETTRTTTVYLAAKEIRVIPDALKTLYGLDRAGGALYIDPARGVNVTSRTYSKQGEGTFGFGMQAIDVFASASPRFPFTFSGAFQGSHFRTNVLITDTSGRGADVILEALGGYGQVGLENQGVSSPSFGVTQTNGLQNFLGVEPSHAGGLVVRPTRGTAVATVVAIDNRTNDPTYFPPDLPSLFVRTIPVIGHLDGAHGAKFRSDLYMLNPGSVSATIILEAKKWDTNDMPARITFTMIPHEARMIPDVLKTLFNMEGVARLRYQAQNGQDIRVTSRTYTVDESGATYGSLIPPLNNFQSATSGETLEILGITGGNMRTNIGLVDLKAIPNGTEAAARIDIIDDRGNEIDSFNVHFNTAGGMQINDVFTARGITPPSGALIRISPSEGIVGAYATLTDNVTNDTTFIGANLAAQ